MKAKCICRMCNATPAVYDSKEMDNCNMLVMDDIKQMCLNKDEDQMESLMQSVNYQAFLMLTMVGHLVGCLLLHVLQKHCTL